MPKIPNDKKKELEIYLDNSSDKLKTMQQNLKNGTMTTEMLSEYVKAVRTDLRFAELLLEQK